MSNQETLSKMKEMRMNGMHRKFKEMVIENKAPELTVDQIINHLVQTEWEERQNRKLNRYIKESGLKYQARIHNIDFKPSRNLNKNRVLQFSECQWINKRENIIITGATGTGKSYFASALGFEACIRGFKVKYLNAMKFFSEMKYEQTSGTYSRTMNKLKKYHLIILDDFGLKPFDMPGRLTLLELLEDRFNFSSTMLLTQIPFESWHELIGDNTIADAVCDRIIHSSHKINLQGDSMRKKYNSILETCYQ